MEENPAYGRAKNHEQSGEYASVTGEDTRDYVYANPSQLQEIKDKPVKLDKQKKGAQTQRCALIAITVTLVITLMIALTAFATGIVALYSLGQESISSVNRITVHTQWAEERYAELLERDNSLRFTVNNLTSQINNPVIRRLNQSCIVDTISCNIGPDMSGLYWRGCLTWPVLPKTIADHFTVDIRCVYDRGNDFLFESAQLIQRSGTVFCSCSVLNPNPSGPDLRILPANINGTCTLEITRCPV